MECQWHPDIDALSFQPERHGGRSFVHRRAFQTLLSFPPSVEDCQNYFLARRAAFQAAAAAKVTRDGIDLRANFHLNSRDLERALVLTPEGNPQIICHNNHIVVSF
jgi:hypothetical protein